MTQPNMLQSALAALDELPTEARAAARTEALGQVLPFVGTAGLVAEQLGDDGAVFSLDNQRPVQNHIQGVHAAATALLAETATGLAFGWHLPADKLPLLKSMRIDYLRRSQGGQRAQAKLTAEQIQQLQSEERGAVVVQVTVTDEAGREPAACEMCWAWVPLER